MVLENNTLKRRYITYKELLYYRNKECRVFEQDALKYKQLYSLREEQYLRNEQDAKILENGIKNVNDLLMLCRSENTNLKTEI